VHCSTALLRKEAAAKIDDGLTAHLPFSGIT
jgi:hypothetical protein